jgi:hypothetical protein
LQFPFLLKHLLPRKKKRKLMPSLPLPLQLLPQQLRQQRLPKVSLLRKTTRKTQPRSNPEDLEDEDFVIDDKVTFGRNRQSLKFGQLVPDNELSDYVRARLYLARMLALKKRQEVWG